MGIRISRITSTHELMIESKTKEHIKSLIKKYRESGFKKNGAIIKSEMIGDKLPYFVFMTKTLKL